MAKPSLGAPAPASPFFSPAPDQSTVSHIEVTVQSVTPNPDGSLSLSVVSGNVNFAVTIFNLPGRPDYKPGDRLILEYPKGQNPLIDYTAGYHADAVTPVSQPAIFNRSNTVSEISTQTAQNNALIPTFRSTIGGVPATCCDGRALHTYLQNGDKFSDWIKGRIEKYGFEQGKDFDFASEISEAKNETRGGHNRKDYHLSINMAKELSMVENNEQGKTARRYFIECESVALGSNVKTEKLEPKKPLSIIPVAKDFTQAFRIARMIGCDKNAAAISANNFVYQSTGTNVMSLLGLTHLESDKQALFFNVSDLQTGISGVKMNKMLAAANLQTNTDGCWIPTEAATKFFRIFDTGKRHSNGTPVQQVKWSKDVLGQLSIVEAA